MSELLHMSSLWHRNPHGFSQATLTIRVEHGIEAQSWVTTGGDENFTFISTASTKSSPLVLIETDSGRAMHRVS